MTARRLELLLITRLTINERMSAYGWVGGSEACASLMVNKLVQLADDLAQALDQSLRRKAKLHQLA